MQVIPVIDLLNSQVVHAQQGKRDTYRPIQSPLVSSSDPGAVIESMLDYYPFNTLYIADLNSIQQKAIEPQHYALIKALCKRYPTVTFWVDAGAVNSSCFSQWSRLPVKPVIGSENVTRFSDYAPLMQQTDAPGILSLDFMNDSFIGDHQILSQSRLWPETVIAMTLDNVGASNGPNWQKLRQINALNKHSKLIAAGGVRQIDDLTQLKTVGVDGVLIATALHQQKISPQEIAEL